MDSKHRYGDYVVLKPDAESCQTLKQLAEKAGALINSELGLYPGDLSIPN